MLTAAEQELLVGCARLEVPPADLARLGALIAGPIRWEPLLDAAGRHGLTPLLHRHLRTLAPGGTVPTGVRWALFGAFHRGATRALQQERELATLLDAFGAAAVPVIVLKGPDLAERVYGDRRLRWSADLDLLVEPGDVERARTVLLAAGYRVAPGILSERFARRHHFNLPFDRADGLPGLVELHWALTDRFTAAGWDAAGLRARACAVTLAGRPAVVLADEDQIAYLAVHADVHGYLNRALVATGADPRFVLDPLSGNRLVWFVDLHELVGARGDAIDWAAVVERARAAGVGEAVATTLTLVNALCGAAVPPAVLASLPRPRASLARRRVLARALRDVAREGSRAGAPARSLLARLGETREDVQFRLVRLLDLWEHALPPLDAVRRRYGLRSGLAACALYPLHVARALGGPAARGAELTWLLLGRQARAWRTRIFSTAARSM